MNIKISSIIAVLSMSVAFAAEPLAVVDSSAQVTESAPAIAPSVSEVQNTLEVPRSTETTLTQPALTTAPEAQVPTATYIAPTAVRNGSTSSKSSNPTEVRRVDTDTLPPVTYYRTTYAPVKTVYVGQESSEDTITLDELRGFVPFKFSFGVQGLLGTYSLTDYDYYSESFTDLTLRAGLTSIFPLNKHTVAMKFSAIFEQSTASNSFYYLEHSSRNKRTYQVKFKERKINFPLLFSFKSPHSNLMFDFGAQASLAIYDKLSYSYKEDGKSFKETVDMLGENFRNELDWSLVFGMEFRANKNIALNLRFDYGLSSLYDTFFDDIIKVSDLTSNSFLIGLTFYVL